MSAAKEEKLTWSDAARGKWPISPSARAQLMFAPHTLCKQRSSAVMRLRREVGDHHVATS